MRALLAALLLIIPCMMHALDVPALRGRVNDNAGVLSPEAVARIEEKLAGIERTDSTQIVVLTITSLEGEVLEEYSIRVAETWKIGMKNLDNGVILLIAKADRKLRIEVGRGLEGRLTDLLSGRIIRNEITPRFKSGDFDGGVEAGIDAIIAVVRGEYNAAEGESDSGKDQEAGSSAYTALIVLFFVVVMLGGISKILGGAAGAVGLPVVGALAFSGLGLAGLAALGGVGLVLGIIVSLMFGSGGRGGGFFLGGMGGGGGSFSGGGFSGGGGGFGGGGASGGW